MKKLLLFSALVFLAALGLVCASGLTSMVYYSYNEDFMYTLGALSFVLQMIGVIGACAFGANSIQQDLLKN